MHICLMSRRWFGAYGLVSGLAHTVLVYTASMLYSSLDAWFGFVHEVYFIQLILLLHSFCKYVAQTEQWSVQT